VASNDPIHAPRHDSITKHPDVHLLLDLDDTLYPASAGLFPLVSARIRSYIERTLGLDERAARVVQRRYWRRYGTSLRGLMLRHRIDPEPFLEFVHGVPVEDHLKAEPDLRALLASLPVTRHVFTNGPAGWAQRVLATLGIEDLFERTFDIVSFGYVPKPNAEPYDVVTQALGAEARIVLVDDSPANLGPARARGWRTVWLRSPESVLGGTRGLSVADPPDADHVVERLDELPGILSATTPPPPRRVEDRG
jgi:putative hydrolase of the HAD superfamily